MGRAVLVSVLLTIGVAASSGAAPAVPDGVRSADRYILGLADPDARRRLETLLLAECLQVLDRAALERLRGLRAERGLPAFSVGWCIRKGHLPWSLDGDWRD